MQLAYRKRKNQTNEWSGFSFSIARGSNGFSLLNVIISLTTLFIIAGNLIKVQNQTSQYTLSKQQERDSTYLINGVYSNLREISVCTNSFTNMSVENAATGIYSAPTAIKKPNGIANDYSVGTVYESGRLKISSYKLGDFETSGAPVVPEVGRAKLRLEIEKTGSPLGPKVIKADVDLVVTRDVNKKLLSCFAVGGNEELWTRNPDGSIYYDAGPTGFVGIGAQSPQAPLHILRESVVGGDQDVILEQYNDQDNLNPLLSGYRARGTKLAPLPVANGDELVSFKSLGYDGDQWVEVAQITFRVDGAVNANDMPTRIDFHTRPPGNAWPVNLPGPVRMTVSSNGNVGIGTQTPSAKLDVVGNIEATGCFYFNGTGFAGTCPSDFRLKSEIQSFNLGLKALKGLKPKTFKYNGLGGRQKSTHDQIGVIAQDLEKTAPELVEKFKQKLHPKDTTESQIRAVNHSPFVYIAINAVKELYAKWSSSSGHYKQELNSIEQKINSIEMIELEED